MADIITSEPIRIEDFTDGQFGGTGAFDKVMGALNNQVESQFKSNRITSNNYAEVYLGALNAGMATAVQLLLGKDKAYLEAKLIEAQIETQEAQRDKIQAEIILVGKQVEQMDKEIELADKQIAKVMAEIDLINSQKDRQDAEIALLGAQTAKVNAEIPLINQQVINAEVEKRLLEADVCKRKAEFDLVMQQIQKLVAETSLLDQKRLTEKAQTDSTNVDEQSLIGRQSTLYLRQGDGFLRSAEQKAAMILKDGWTIQRSTDPTGVSANAVNRLNDDYVGNAIAKLLAGINA